jgi:preprotein translocase subunit YajC
MIAAMAVFGLTSLVAAQDAEKPQAVWLTGTIKSVGETSLVVEANDKETTLELNDKTVYRSEKSVGPDAIKSGNWLNCIGKPNEDKTLIEPERVILSEEELPGAAPTIANWMCVGVVDVSDGKITLKAGDKSIEVKLGDATPVNLRKMLAKGDLKAGDSVRVQGGRVADVSTATLVAVLLPTD